MPNRLPSPMHKWCLWIKAWRITVSHTVMMTGALVDLLRTILSQAMLPEALAMVTAFPKTFQTSKMFPKGMQSRTTPLLLSSMVKEIKATCPSPRKPMLLVTSRMLAHPISRTFLLLPKTTRLLLPAKSLKIKASLQKALAKPTAFPKGTTPLLLSSMVKEIKE